MRDFGWAFIIVCLFTSLPIGAIALLQHESNQDLVHKIPKLQNDIKLTNDKFNAIMPSCFKGQPTK